MEELVRRLLRPEAYPGIRGEVSFLETHISVLFFVGRRVYKVKKSVDRGFLDYTTLERRLHFCKEEVRLNRRLAEETYLGVVPVVRLGDGTLQMGGDGEVVDYAVEMERLPAERMLDRLLARSEIDNSHMNGLVDLLVRFHAEARTGEGVDRYGSVDGVLFNCRENFEQSEPVVGPTDEGFLVSSRLHRFLRGRAERFVETHRELFEERVAKGRIREGHGDLHAGNICYTDGGIVIYDCIEFAERLRCGDVAADLGFLAMDLDRRRFRGFSSYLVKRYAEEASDHHLELLIPFYKAYRSLVRAKIAGFRWTESGEPTEQSRARAEGMRYFHLAASYELPPSLLLTCGLPGTGKSWAADAVRRPFEAVLARSDVRRKRIAGVPLEVHRREGWQSGLYTPELTDRTYEALLEEAREALDAGRTVVVDATFPSRSRRQPFRELAAEKGAPFLLLAISAPEELVRRRLAARAETTEEASDADFGIYLRARELFEPPTELPPASVLEAPSEIETAEELSSRVLDRLLELAGEAS